MGDSSSASFVAALAYSGAKDLQWPHHGASGDKKVVNSWISIFQGGNFDRSFGVLLDYILTIRSLHLPFRELDLLWTLALTRPARAGDQRVTELSLYDYLMKKWVSWVIQGGL